MRDVSLPGIVLLALLAACSSGLSTDVDADTSTTSADGFTYGNLTCEQAGYEDAVGDYGEDAIGFETVEEAIDAYRTEGIWQLRKDWQTLTQSDTNSTQFLDDKGRVYLDIHLIRLNDTWLVGGFESCAPPGA